jgi:hypothetical protein
MTDREGIAGEVEVHLLKLQIEREEAREQAPKPA